MGGQHHAPVALPPRKTLYPLYRKLGGPQRLSGGVRKISPPPGFDPRTVQPVASRYTDCAIPALARPEENYGKPVRIFCTPADYRFLTFLNRNQKYYNLTQIVLLLSACTLMPDFKEFIELTFFKTKYFCVLDKLSFYFIAYFSQ